MKKLFQLFLLALLSIAPFVQLSAQEVWATDSINRTLTPAGSRYYLAHPFEILYGPDDSLYISEKVGRIRIVSSITGLSRIILDRRASTFLNITRDGAGVATGIGQNGMMGIALDKNFKQGAGPHYIYVAYSYNASSLRISRFTYNLSTGQLGSELQLVNGIPAAGDHSSGRLVYGTDDKLYYTCGDLGANQFASRCSPIRSQDLPTTAEVSAQTYTKYQGKILRINPDGTIPSDNPLLDPDGAGAEVAVRSHIFSYGHRNAQGLVFEMNPNNGSSYPTLKTGGIIYSSEHGIRTDDEINIINSGNNYGWPFWAGFRNNPAENYRYINWSTASGGNCSSTGYNEVVIPAGAAVTQENSFAAGSFTDPIFSMYPACNGAPNCNVTLTGGTNWMQYPTIAPSSIDHYGFTNIPGWHQSLLIPTLRRGTLYRYKLNATRNGIVNDSVPYFFRADRYRDLALKNGTIIFTVTDSIGSTSGPSGGGTSSLTRPGTILKYTFLGYANNAGTSTIPTSIAIDAGTLNSCVSGSSVTINATNNNLWVPITGPDGNVIAEIKANGNNLGNVTSSFYTRTGSPVRQIASGDKYANRNITINAATQPTAGNPASVRLYINTAELASIIGTTGSGVTSITDLGVFKNSDPCGSTFAGSITTQQLVTGRYVHGTFGHAIQANIQSFSSFYFFNTSSTLPVDFITISAAEQNNAAKIQWTVTNQGNISSYIVERSIDNRNFDAAGTVAAVTGNGDITYSFIDYNAARFNAVVYYRVRAIEQTGQFKFTNVVNVAFGAEIKEMITLFPNPANDKTSVSIASNNDEVAQLRIIDNTGRVVSQRSINIVKGKNTFELNTSNISTGLYYVEVNGKTINQKIKLIKQ